MEVREALALVRTEVKRFRLRARRDRSGFNAEQVAQIYSEDRGRGSSDLQIRALHRLSVAQAIQGLGIDIEPVALFDLPLQLGDGQVPCPEQIIQTRVHRNAHKVTPDLRI
jgi:hypothetical protein